jgi:hypothetical protein
MNEEKKLSDDELKDIAGGIKNYNSSKSNTSKIDKPDDVDPKARFEAAPKVKGK